MFENFTVKPLSKVDFTLYRAAPNTKQTRALRAGARSMLLLVIVLKTFDFVVVAAGLVGTHYLSIADWCG